MLTSSRALLVTLAVLVTTGCKKPETGSAAATDAGAAVSAPRDGAAAASPADAGGPHAAVLAVVNAWNGALDRHDAEALADVYASEVDYYGSKTPGPKVVASKRAALKAAPTFKQALDDVTFEPAPSGGTIVRFTKRSGPANAMKPVRASVLVVTEGGKLRVARETDDASEKHATEGACITLHEDDEGAETVTVEGKVDTGKHSHPNGTMFDFTFVRLDKPRCLRGSGNATSVTDIQLMGGSDEMDEKLKSFVGKTAKVTGTALTPMTAWHVRDVLLDVKTIAPR